MNICKHQFLKLSLDQQISVLEILGVFLAFRRSGEYNVLLYGIAETYYVEIKHDEAGDISSIEIISDESVIEFYLQNLSLGNLLALQK
jgi:hypothetical protein